MSLDWSNLPPHVLEEVFLSFDVRELKFLSLVCKSWYYETARILKKRVCFNCESLPTPECLEIIKESERTYETLAFGGDTALVKEIIESLKARKTSIKHVQVHGRSDNLDEILNMTANYCSEINSLSVCFDDEIASRTTSRSHSHSHLSRMASMRQLSHLNVQNVSSAAFINQFSDLRSVHLSCRGDMTEVLQALVQNSRLTISELKLSGLMENTLHFINDFHNLHSLSLMSLRPYTFPQFISDRILFLNLQNCRLTDEVIATLKGSCPNLQGLEFNFSEEKNVTEEGVKNLWKINSLLYLRLIGFKYSNQVWEETFSSGTNKRLQTLSFGSLDVNDGFLEICANYNPCLREVEFDGYYGSRVHLIGIQALLRLKHLESLTLKDIEISFSSISNKDDFKLSSKSLKHLHITHRGQIPSEFFESLKAPNLRTLSLEFWKYKLTLEEIGCIIKNCPKVEILKLFTFDDIHVDVVEALSRNLVNLKRFECNYLDVDGFLMLLVNCPLLSYAKIDVRLETSDISFLLEKVSYFRLRIREVNFSKFKFFGERIEMDVKFVCEALE